MRWLVPPLLAGLLSAAVAAIRLDVQWWAIVFAALCLVPLARRDRFVWLRGALLVAASWVALRVSIQASAQLYGVVKGPANAAIAAVIGALLVGIAARLLVPLRLKARAVATLVALAAVAGAVLGLGPTPALYMGVFLWQLSVGGVLARARAESASPTNVLRGETA
jgi:hypothetical protein